MHRVTEVIVEQHDNCQTLALVDDRGNRVAIFLADDAELDGILSAIEAQRVKA